MTLYELLHQVSFDEIVPFIERYHGWNALALYKIHYDYLRHLTPELGERTTATVSNGELDESWPEPHLAAHPLEGDFWEHSLAKELIIEPDVKASLAEIAMCCLRLRTSAVHNGRIWLSQCHRLSSPFSTSCTSTSSSWTSQATKGRAHLAENRLVFL